MVQKFGKYAIIDPVTFHFEKEGDWWWKIKPPTSGDELNLRKFMNDGRIVLAPDGTRRSYAPNMFEQAYREIALTFAGTNIPADEGKKVEDGGEPIIKVGSSIEVIEGVLLTMPTEFIMEIWGEVGKAVPLWGPVIAPIKPVEADPNLDSSPKK